MRRTIFILLLFITSCNFSATQAPTSTPVNTPVPTVTVTQIPAVTNTPISIPAREKYTFDTIIDYDLHLVTVTETILYPNHTGQRLDSVTLAIAANLWENCFKLETIKVDDIRLHPERSPIGRHASCPART